MADLDGKEVITQSQFWFSNTVQYDRRQMEYEVLRLTNKSKCTFVELTMEEGKNKDKKKIIQYSIVAEGTKQHLLLLKHMMVAWVWGSNFQPTNAKPL